MAVINPDVIIGPMIQPMENGEKVNQTNMGNVYAFLNGRYKIVEKARFAFYQFVDVRDVAEAHVRAMTIPEAGGKPLILVSGTISPRLVCEIIGRRFPDLSNRLPKVRVVYGFVKEIGRRC
jgi:nucleoside-diphosphate-sugar epimerase